MFAALSFVFGFIFVLVAVALLFVHVAYIGLGSIAFGAVGLYLMKTGMNDIRAELSERTSAFYKEHRP